MSCKILRMKDPSDSYVIDKSPLDSVPFRMIITGKSGVGKGVILGNLFLRKEFYLNNFYGDQIFIFSPLKNDNKMKTLIKVKEIPEENVFDDYDKIILETVYNNAIKDFDERVKMGKKPYNVCIILDDLSYSSAFIERKDNIIDEMFCNSRKHNVSILITSQKYASQISTCQRANFTSLIAFNTSNRELDAIIDDNNYLPNKKSFMKMWRSEIRNKRDFLVINHSNEIDKLYLDKDFKPIDTSKYIIE